MLTGLLVVIHWIAGRPVDRLTALSCPGVAIFASQASQRHPKDSPMDIKVLKHIYTYIYMYIYISLLQHPIHISTRLEWKKHAEQITGYGCTGKILLKETVFELPFRVPGFRKRKIDCSIMWDGGRDGSL